MRIIDPATIDLPEKGDVRDWLEAHPKATVEDVLALIPQVIMVHEQDNHYWPKPEDLGDELPPVPEFEAELLPSSLRPLVCDVADRMQVPFDFPATAICSPSRV